MVDLMMMRVLEVFQLAAWMVFSVVRFVVVLVVNAVRAASE